MWALPPLESLPFSKEDVKGVSYIVRWLTGRMNMALRKGGSQLLAFAPLPAWWASVTWPVHGHSLPIVLIVPGTQTHSARPLPFKLAQGSRVKFPNEHLLLDSFLSAQWFEVLSRIPTYQKAQERRGVCAVSRKRAPHATDRGSREIGAKMRPPGKTGITYIKFTKCQTKKQINTETDSQIQLNH